MRRGFYPMGQTVAAMANGVSAAYIINADSPSNEMQFVNSSNTVIAFFRISTSSLANSSIAQLPAQGAPGYSTPLLPLTSLVYSGWQAGGFSNVTVSIITAGPNVTALIYITPGEGN